MKPYTYLIRWTKLNISYYGVRYSQDCDPSDLWNPYKTSSQHVADFIAKHGDPDVIEVRKTFIDVSVAQNWEYKVLRRIKAVSNNRWLNRTDNKSITPLYGEDHPHYGKTGEAHHSYGKPNTSVSLIQKERFNNKTHQFLDPIVRAKSVASRSGSRHHMKRPEIADKNAGVNHYSKKVGYVPLKAICQYCSNTYSASNIGKHEPHCKSKLTSLVANTDLDVYNN
jgi:hypothetical protein